MGSPLPCAAFSTLFPMKPSFRSLWGKIRGRWAKFTCVSLPDFLPDPSTWGHHEIRGHKSSWADPESPAYSFHHSGQGRLVVQLISVIVREDGDVRDWNYENGRAQDICHSCVIPQAAPLDWTLSPFLSPPLHVGILLIFSLQVDRYSSHSDLLCWNFKNHCAFHIVWPISYFMQTRMERSCHTDTHRHTHRDAHAHAHTDAHTSYICKHTHTQSNFIILWLFWTNRILGVSLTLIGEETGAESLGDFLQVGRKWRAIFIFIFTLIKVLYANLDVEVNCPLLSSRGEERIFCRRKGFRPKPGRWAQCCETVAGDSVVWSTARIPFKCIQVEATEYQRGKTAWT